MLGRPASRLQHVAALRLCYGSPRAGYHLRVADTELLYATDAYLRSFEARVEEITADGGVVLDRTAFYPTGGGQPHDTGQLGQATVVDVFEDDSGTIYHVVEQPVLFTPGEIVTG